MRCPCDDGWYTRTRKLADTSAHTHACVYKCTCVCVCARGALVCGVQRGSRRLPNIVISLSGLAFSSYDDRCVLLFTRSVLVWNCSTAVLAKNHFNVSHLHNPTYAKIDRPLSEIRWYAAAAAAAVVDSSSSLRAEPQFRTKNKFATKNTHKTNTCKHDYINNGCVLNTHTHTCACARTQRSWCHSGGDDDVGIPLVIIESENVNMRCACGSCSTHTRSAMFRRFVSHRLSCARVCPLQQNICQLG